MFSEAQHTDTEILIYTYILDQEPAQEEEKTPFYPTHVYEENGIYYCASTTQNGVYWYAYCLNNPLVYVDENGEFWHIVIGAVVGGVINVATNWKSIDNIWEGVAAFGVGAGTGALTAVNPALGSMLGGSLTSATNNLIGQTGDGTGFQNVNWGEVGANGAIGLATGAATFGMGSAINSTGITNKLLDATGINNTIARNLVGSTINGTMMGSTAGFVNGVATGVATGEWNVWEYTWKGAALGAAGGLAYGTVTELGYQAQLKWGRGGLNSSNTETLAGLAQDGVNQFNSDGTVIDGGNLGGITVVYNTSSSTSTVYINTTSNVYWQPPLPYQYTSPNFDNIIRLLRLF